MLVVTDDRLGPFGPESPIILARSRADRLRADRLRLNVTLATLSTCHKGALRIFPQDRRLILDAIAPTWPSILIC
jgi:hypothetical protein